MVQSTAPAVLQRASHQHQDWFEDNNAAISNLLTEKNRLHKAYVKCPTSDNKAAFYSSRRLLQRQRFRFSSQRRRNHPTSRQTLKRWAKHFRVALNRPSNISDAAIARMPQVETNANFDLVPSLHETINAVQQLSNGKGDNAQDTKSPRRWSKSFAGYRNCFFMFSSHLQSDSEWTVKSAEEFLTRIKHLEVEADEVMVSFDVISLFTSIPPALAINTIDGFLREKYDETDQQLKRAHIIELLELCLKTFFTVNGQVYEQKKGTPMGSPLSGLIAEAVLQRLERQVFSSYPPKFWARYVDDTFVVIKRSEMKAFKALLNSIFPDMQFTMEEEVNNQLPFLDVQITRLTDGKIRTTVYRKATNTRRILHFRSNHPVGHKRSCVRTLFQRVQTHCSDDSGRKEEMNYLQALFKANGYPKSFIRNCLKKPHFERSSGEKPKFWLSIPYVKNVSEATARILKPFGIGVAHKPECTIRQQIMKPKDPLPTTEQSAVVYSIPCLNCNARYVGETGKRLGTRLHEHQLAINRKDKLSLVYGHVRELNHNFAFDKARVIGRANEKMARLVLESWSSTGAAYKARISPDNRARGTESQRSRKRAELGARGHVAKAEHCLTDAPAKLNAAHLNSNDRSVHRLTRERPSGTLI
ncbi:hypothetical protein SprV_0100169800 [Sparganum proliferum]